MMKWESVLSEHRDTECATAEVVLALRERLGTPDLVILFASTHHVRGYATICSAIRTGFPRAVFVGCSAGGVIGGGREVEEEPALTLMGAILPDVTIGPIRFDALPKAGDPNAWRARVGFPGESDVIFLMLPDGFTCDTESLIRGLDLAYPGARILGGLASGGSHPGTNILFLNDQIHRSGAVGVALRGNIRLDTVVAQGCRPIGEPMILTRVRDNVVVELDRGKPVPVLQKLYASLDRRDAALFDHSLFLGVEMQSKRSQYQYGDFLIRNILGVDPETGALGVSTHLEPYQVVQFHLRDARTSTEDLVRVLSHYRGTRGAVRPSAALLFSCLGRGKRFYGQADHDSIRFRSILGSIPLGGFFCDGEIGRVADQTFLHGYTSAFGMLLEKSPKSPGKNV